MSSQRCCLLLSLLLQFVGGDFFGDLLAFHGSQCVTLVGSPSDLQDFDAIIPNVALVFVNYEDFNKSLDIYETINKHSEVCRNTLVVSLSRHDLFTNKSIDQSFIQVIV